MNIPHRPSSSQSRDDAIADPETGLSIGHGDENVRMQGGAS